MNRHWTDFGQSKPVCLRSRSASEPAVLVSGDTLAPVSVTVSPALDPSKICIGPYPPAALGCVSVSQRLTTYETASRTFPGTLNSLAADANADWSDEGGAADAGPPCARMRIAATTYASRCVMPSLLYRSGGTVATHRRASQENGRSAGWNACCSYESASVYGEPNARGWCSK